MCFICKNNEYIVTAGMPMIDALEISASTMKNVLYYDALEKVKSGVSLGLPLSNQLRTSGLFPPMVVHMVGNWRRNW